MASHMRALIALVAVHGVTSPVANHPSRSAGTLLLSPASAVAAVATHLVPLSTDRKYFVKARTPDASASSRCLVLSQRPALDFAGYPLTID